MMIKEYLERVYSKASLGWTHEVHRLSGRIPHRSLTYVTRRCYMAPPQTRVNWMRILAAPLPHTACPVGTVAVATGGTLRA